MARKESLGARVVAGQGVRLWAPILASALGVVLGGAITRPATASEAFVYSGKAIHPGCVHALVMSEGDKIPVIRSISLPGCMASTRSQAKMVHHGDVVTIEDEALLGDGSVGYRHVSTLDNGLFLLGIRRVLPNGSQRVSLAAVRLSERPALFAGEVVVQPVLEMIGEVWVKDIQMASLRTVGNVIHFSAGVGASRMDRRVDLSRIGKATK